MEKAAAHIMSIIFLTILITGCYHKVPVTEEKPAEEPPAAEEQTVHILEPEEKRQNITEETIIEETKQLKTGGATDIEEQELSVISDIRCSWGPEGPEKFSFRITNIEQKTWSFSSLSYDAMETKSKPVVVLNALQMRNDQLIAACGRKTLLPGATTGCDFKLDAPEHVLVRKHLRTGLTPLGSENENTLSVRTESHAAEARFLCE